MNHCLVGYEPLFSYVWRIQGGCLAGYETHGKLDRPYSGFGARPYSGFGARPYSGCRATEPNLSYVSKNQSYLTYHPSYLTYHASYLAYHGSYPFKIPQITKKIWLKFFHI